MKDENIKYCQCCGCKLLMSIEKQNMMCWDCHLEGRLNSVQGVHECDAIAAQSKGEPMANNSLNIVSGDSSKGGDLEVSDSADEGASVVSHPCTSSNTIEHGNCECFFPMFYKDAKGNKICPKCGKVVSEEKIKAHSKK